MSIQDEMQVYNSAPVSQLTGETDSYDEAFFPNIIRKRELELIRDLLFSHKPTIILDYGCGGGWLSTRLRKWDFSFVGVDVSKKMVKNAKIACHKADLVVCDAMRLPFKDDTFDFVIGISILHHLKLNDATNELKRVSTTKSVSLFMEPNLLNPLSSFGRKIFPMEAHTKGEKPYTPGILKKSLEMAGFNVERCFAIFFLAFAIARFSRITHTHPPSSFVRLIYFFELLMEKAPGIGYFNSTIITLAKHGGMVIENSAHYVHLSA